MRAPDVILDKPQLAENIGAVARVMANFGLDELRLVSPRDGWPQDRAWAAASGADWVVDAVKVFASVPEGIADLQVVWATTGRPRDLRMEVRTPREAMEGLQSEVHGGQSVGLAVDLFNAFNSRNFGCYDARIPRTGQTNANFGRPSCSAPGRRLQLGLTYDFGPSITGTGGR